MKNSSRIESIVKKIISEDSDRDKKYYNPETKNYVGYARALQLGLIKPEKRKTSVDKPVFVKKKKKIAMDKNKPKAWWSSMTKHNLSIYPVNIPEDQVKVDLSGDINTHAVLTWRNPRTGKMVQSYTKKFLENNAKIKWKRVAKIKPENVSKIQEKVNKILTSSNTDDNLKQAAAIIGIIANTGLRVGSTSGFETTGNRGVSTLSSDNIKISGDTIKLNFIGKSYQENEAEIKDATLASYLKKKQEERANDKFLFTIPKSFIDKTYDDMGMKNFKIKDLRTYVATKVATKLLFEDPSSPPPLPENPREIKKLVKEKLKTVFEKVSQVLNNTPAMARTSYVHPIVINNWLDKIGVTAKFVGYESTIKEVEENTEDLDVYDDVDIYPLPEWWDSESIELVKKF